MNDRELVNRALDSRLEWDGQHYRNLTRRRAAEEQWEQAQRERAEAAKEADWAAEQWRNNPDAAHSESEFAEWQRRYDLPGVT